MANIKPGFFTQDTSPVQEVMLPYKSCKGCRDKDKIYNTQHRATIHNVNDTSDDENDNDCYHDGCVEYDCDGDMVGFREI